MIKVRHGKKIVAVEIGGKRIPLAPSTSPAEKGPMTSKAYQGGLVSVGAGVHPDQVAEFNAATRAAGLTGVEYLPNGDVRFDSRGQRAAELRRRGMHDRDGGYGDG